MLGPISRHKFISGLILLIVIGGGYYLYQQSSGKEGAVRYVTAAVEKGTFIVSVAGSGQVSASDQVDVKPKVSGDVTRVAIENGQEVKAGVLLVQIDSREALKAKRDAETALETAKLELDDLLQPADALALMQSENSLSQARDSLTKLKLAQKSNRQEALDSRRKAEDNLKKAYEDAFTATANAFLDLPATVTALRDILYSEAIADSERGVSRGWNISALTNSVVSNSADDQQKLGKFIASAENNYKTARVKYDDSFEHYRGASRYSERAGIEALLAETIETVRTITETIKSETNMLDFWADCRSRMSMSVFSKITTYQSDLRSYSSKINSHLSSLLSIQKTIADNKEAKVTAERNLAEAEQNDPLDLAASERSIKEKEESLAKLKAGADSLDIRAKRIAVQQKQDALTAAQQTLADHFVRAPFDGVVAALNAKKGQAASSGSTLVTLITKQQTAEITLNEVDAAKVKAGQKATITFDAIEDLSISGAVADIDTLGTVTQGVVNYNIRIGFDVQDERVKPGMSISVAIVTNAKPDALFVPSSAVKEQGGAVYVEILENNVPRRQAVHTGLASDTLTEIAEGLQEGQLVVTQTVTSNNGSSAGSSNRSSGGAPGGLPGGMGGVMRMVR